jgi:arylsulfatase A-like enzyme
VSDAQRWVRSLGPDQPFFVWLTFAEPHNPYQVPEPYFSMFPQETIPPAAAGTEALKEKGFKWEWVYRLGKHVYPNYDELVPRARANYLGMLRLIDDQVRRFVGFLDAEGLRDDTLVIFLADHGDFVGEYGLVRKGPEMPELLMRIPLLFHGPGIVANEEPHPAFVSICDVMPTLCEMLGAPLPEGVQGRSLWPMLTGGDYPEAEFESAYGEHGYGGLHYEEADHYPFDRATFQGPKGPTFDCLNSVSQSGQMRMIRKGDWKLTLDMQGHGQLYNLADDPVELVNLYGRPEHADLQRELLADLLAWTLRAQDPLPLPRHRYIMKTDPRNYWAPYRGAKP